MSSLDGRVIPSGTYRWRSFENLLTAEALYAPDRDAVSRRLRRSRAPRRAQV